MKRPEDWHGGWILATWVGAGLLLLVAVQLAGLGDPGVHDPDPRYHTRAFLLAVGALLLAAVPIYVTDRWLRGRSGREPPEAGREREPDGETGDPPAGADSGRGEGGAP